MSRPALTETEHALLSQSLLYADENRAALRKRFFGLLFERHPETEELFGAFA